MHALDYTTSPARYTHRDMDVVAIMVFCGAVVLGSYVQAATGFAMALVVLAIVTAGRVLDVAVVAAVISLLALLNVTLALRGEC